ncbi:MAG: response regulator [bacterium]
MAEKKQPLKNNNKIKIVIVEDDPFLLGMYVTKLEMTGFDVSGVEDGKEAVPMVEKEMPDLVLLDIILPNVDGFEILKKLKKQDSTKDIPIIIFTNLGQQADVEKGLELGAVDYLIKAHFTPSEVIEKVNRIIKK